MPAATSYVVRYGLMKSLGEFAGLPGQDHPRGQQVVLQTDRGVELGEVLTPATDRTAMFLANPARGSILRPAVAEDLQTQERLAELGRQGLVTCQEIVERRRLRMTLVDVEPILGGERLVFYYVADERVDFRELVRELTRKFNSRIEMRQIGVRDEAKLLADYGDCGKPVCCNTHLSKMPPVTMKMAKTQKTTLDPSKISGRCGRLKCCLRYEFETYQGLERELPPVGARVSTPRGSGRVLAQEILAKKLVVELEDGRRLVVAGDEVTGFEARKSGRADPRDKDDRVDR